MSDTPSGLPSAETRPPASPMRTGLFKFGAAATILWLAVGFSLMMWASDRGGTLKPNEWGDAFAGLFAPVAFLWLVLGFLQQGTELQLSTRALELQVAELKNSVEQQQALVEVSRKQVLATLDEHERRRSAEHAITQPRLIVRPVGKLSGPSSNTTYELEVTNEGETITNVSASFIPQSAGKSIDFYQTLRRGESKRFRFIGQDNFRQLEMSIAFVDINLAQGLDRFVITPPEGANPHYSQLRIIRSAE